MSKDINVLISYSARTQQGSAENLALSLRSDGYVVVLCDDIGVTSDSNEYVQNTLIFIALLDEAYTESAQCMSDICYAFLLHNQPRSNRIPHILPVVFRDSTGNVELFSNPDIAVVLNAIRYGKHDAENLITGTPETFIKLLKLTRNLLNQAYVQADFVPVPQAMVSP